VPWITVGEGDGALGFVTASDCGFTHMVKPLAEEAGYRVELKEELPSTAQPKERTAE